ncbi:Protoporphyrinogen oxidase [Jaminaea rosea]|uniref:Protoporphyrinogen oxidase n=1 Tax=Jaminaea rosea TaxID=1569628 RepID=A0A316UT13_9BASI|nr:Protoporphyrinogen oxidase [Jaminaea rosea]PWN28427.1 Protoporphyrinogen oxidase [Jaminaea rosea]
MLATQSCPWRTSAGRRLCGARLIPSTSLSWPPRPRAAVQVRTLESDAGQRSPTPTTQPPIAVLGAGLSGLTTTLYLSRALPHRRIILFEASQRLGGWVQSERLQLPSGKQSVLLEAGPRSVRPKGVSGWSTIETLHSLGLLNQLLIVPSSSPSAKNRFIWYGGQLNKLPSSLPAFLASLFRLPVLRSLISSALSGLLREPFRPSRFARPKSESPDEVARQRSREHLIDESVESYIRRRFGDSFGSQLLNNVLSAVLHGIYAADTRQLSVRSTLSMLWKTEQRHGSLLRAILPPKWNKRYRPPTKGEEEARAREEQEIAAVKAEVGPEWTAKLEKTSVYSLREGLGEIVTAMSDEITARRNVSVRLGDGVEGISEAKDGASLFVTTQDGEDVPVSRVISTLSSYKLADILANTIEGAKPVLEGGASVLSLLRHNPSTNVAVVTFAIPQEAIAAMPGGRRHRLLPVDEGFGFLVPRTETPNNADGILGVVFDSDAIPDQDSPDGADGGVTKLTVMMGGPHFAHATTLPSEDECLNRAVRALDRFLSIPESVSLHSSSLVQARVQANCIPTYLPGHYSRMRSLGEELARATAAGGGRVAVAGASYTGVSVNDVIREAKLTAQRIARAEEREKANGGGDIIAVTGLEAFAAED